LQKLKPAVEAVIPSNADSDPHTLMPLEVGKLPVSKPPSAVETTRTESSRRVHPAAGQTTSRPTSKEWNADERWLAH
jgi:hypothetical protein